MPKRQIFRRNVKLMQKMFGTYNNNEYICMKK